MANVNKVEKESGESLSRAYYEANEITVSSDWRVSNLVLNATPKTTFVRKSEVIFKYAKGQLSYVVPTKFLSRVQMAKLTSLVNNLSKPKK